MFSNKRKEEVNKIVLITYAKVSKEEFLPNSVMLFKN